MVHLIDRRIQGKNKSAPNRERFLRRYKEQIKGAVARAVKGRSITDIDSGENIAIPVKDVSEPNFGHAHGGIWEAVHPGNEQYQKGDQIARPKGDGSGKGQGGNSDDPAEDDFVFQLSREEFLNYFFEDLALPNMLKTQLTSTTDFKSRRAGYKTSGSAASLHVLRSLRGAMGRRIAMGGKSQRRLHLAEGELQELLAAGVPEEALTVLALRHEIQHLRTRLLAIPFLDPLDLRYSNRVKIPQPASQCVMFCLLDVSGSMDEQKKDTAKRFFILLYLFLTRAYEKIEVVFIRHHTTALEVDEEAFFHSRESGGTIVSSALKLLTDTIRQRYTASDWNVYVAQASDGDNWDNDSVLCRELLINTIMPMVQYYAYVEITEGEPQNLWLEYQRVAASHRHFAMQKIETAADIYPVFRELFKKQPT
ncbi:MULTISPECIES: YeaH/YhbH family protein [unclassified Undibacterium]|uniref:YeaH/YhbH family protein n=1 Tax=unclassified Undibacterium TaxID=2630295 RepID=UPI002AC9C823|nr:MULTISPECIES: YeaH/YhbH family protein [unclassified Undibacterium]MEB0140279.1 YeaH/YhbH family protein [Undibacterium sp. CCC2.1]MEB0173307.1 YeaH/YhbH family protein [Undibacterium sp. CCC1.1]MEB0177126.1 YeaH/YhbH family protein [Undibacterium sp. CCC3.4]MEB0216418.1 YeaH/YhbH family protein [Undibacterium sp. 5I2]WPX45528.1 YeaH/YhbH family protein [Undibacterium sp. CCC3.4]